MMQLHACAPGEDLARCSMLHSPSGTHHPREDQQICQRVKSCFEPASSAVCSLLFRSAGRSMAGEDGLLTELGVTAVPVAEVEGGLLDKARPAPWLLVVTARCCWR